ncbi:hypothetical protein RB195_011094 [Necator americanus]|uniref:CX domain-containing protein n=1 Tax=Necator americanus TaxID=51031 RepID=A0ABR1D254_NECAM
MSRARSSASHRRSSSPRFTRKFSKVGSIQRTSMFRATVFGAAAGYLTFRAGRHFINDPSKPIMFDSRSYYWSSDLQTPTEELPVQCVNRIDPQDPQFGRVYYANESRPTEIVYGCAEGDYCCGYDCCQEGTFFTSLFRLLILILVFSIVGHLKYAWFPFAFDQEPRTSHRMPYFCDQLALCCYTTDETRRLAGYGTVTYEASRSVGAEPNPPRSLESTEAGTLLTYQDMDSGMDAFCVSSGPIVESKRHDAQCSCVSGRA